MAEDKIDELIRQLASRGVSLSSNSENALVRMGEPAVPALIDALKDENTDVQWRATRVLGRIGDAKAVPALIDGLKDKKWDVWRQAATALVAIGKPAIPAVISTLKDKDLDVRKRAVMVLGDIAEENPGNAELLNAVPLLIEALEDENSDVRAGAARALGEIKDPRAVPALLIEALKNNDDKVRKSAGWALDNIARENPGSPELVRATSTLVNALKDEDAQVRINAVSALAKIKDARAVPALISALKDENYFVRQDAAGALGEIDPSLTDIHLRETEGLLRQALEKAEGEEKKKLLNLLDEINKRRNKILEPEAKKLKPPKRIKRKRKPKRRMWRAAQ